MSRLPDRFDLWMRKARQAADPARQADLILGALVAQKELHFLNIGTKASPLLAKTAIALDECVLIFTDRDRIEEFIAGHPALQKTPEDGPPIITSPTASALKWCVENKAGLVINPGGEETAMVPWREVSAFLEEWHRRGAAQAAGFWIPNMTTEEEDFWQEHGL
jgi:hypothetical protein